MLHSASARSTSSSRLILMLTKTACLPIALRYVFHVLPLGGERRHHHVGQRRRAKTGLPALFRHLLIERGALFESPSQRSDHRFHLLGREFLAMLGAGGARDALVHQGAAEIVDAALQKRRDALLAKLDP